MATIVFTPTAAAPVPVSSDNFQRAVFKAAPKRFSIEFLPPTKVGSTWHHGMRICSVSRGDRTSRDSMASSDSVTQYDIWRRWEDCLWLQDTLELEYKRSARERRMRLAQGKGVKTFNGMYKQDMASSWESLPPGPEPNSVSTDVHTYLPYLVKKNSFFRPNPATIDNRQKDFQALIEALMSDDMPALVKEIRASRIITDFFGYWRRDLEFEEKWRKKNPHLATAPRSSITSSVFSTYFSSTSSQASLGTHSRSSKRSLTSMSSWRPASVAETLASTVSTATNKTFKPSSSLESPEAMRQAEREARRHSSSSESSTQSEEAVSDSSCTANSSAPKIAEESPVKANYNPNRGREPPSPTEPDSEFFHKSPSPLDNMAQAIHIHRRVKSPAGDRRSNRSCQVFSSPPKELHDSKSHEELPIIRESWQSNTSSASAYLDRLNLSLPQSPSDERQSVATLRTIDSADGVLPSSARHSLDDYFEIFSESDGKVSLLNSFPRPLSFLPEESDSRPETPTSEFNIRTPPRRIPQALPNLVIPNPNSSYFSTPSPLPPPSPLTPSPISEQQQVPPSPTMSTYSNTFSISTVASEAPTVMEVSTPLSAIQTPSSATSISSPVKPGNITLKVSHSGSIIMLKVARDIAYPDLRQRIFNKFVGQEGVPLSHSFVVMLHERSSSGSEDSAKEIDSDFEWREISDTFEGSKLMLRIVDSS
ncbi:hypothetical protein H1R20_g15152, partial [Candolleomyces eurysporus]